MTDTAQHIKNLRKRVPVIRESRAPVAKASDIAGVEWIPVRDEAQRSSTRVFDSRAFADIQSAIDTAHAAGGGEVFIGDAIPPGLDIVLKDGVYLTGRGSGATEISINTITASGSLSALPALGANAVRHGRVVEFTASPDLAPGDVFILYNSTDYSFSTSRSYYRQGEFCRVQMVSGTTVELTKPLYGNYATGGAVTAHKMIPIRTGISGMTVHCTAGKHGIRVDLGTDLVFNDLVLDGTDVSHLTLSRCYNVDLDGVRAFDVHPETEPNALNYGVMILNSQRLLIANCDLETRRHGLTMGGDNSLGCVPCRDIMVVGGSISGMSSVPGVAGCNVHGNAEDIHFSFVKMPAGFNPAGDRLSIRGCEIGSAPWGSCVSGGELLGMNLTFENNVFRPTSNHPADRATVYLLFDDAATRGNCTLRFNSNFVDMGPYTSAGAATYALYVLINSDNVPATNEMDIKGNTFRTTAPVTANSYGARIRTAVTSQGFQSVRSIANTGNLPVRVDAGMNHYFVGTGMGEPTRVAAKGSEYTRLDGGDGSTKYVNVTGTSVWKAVA